MPVEMAFTRLPLELFGFRVMGDVGGFTCYTDARFRKVFYKKAPPKEPASPAQAKLRARFGDAIRAWKALTADEKAALERAVKKTSLCLTGQNLFVSCMLKAAPGVYATIADQSSEDLPALPPPP